MCFDITVGQRIRIKGSEYRVVDAQRRDRGVTLRTDDENGTALRISRAELQALIVLEEAEFVDELEDPDGPPKQFGFMTDLLFLSPHRLHDWQLKVILLRAMLPVRNLSYKSATFRRTYKAASELLDACRSLSPVIGGRTWSIYNVYHTLRSWRASGYAYASLQKQGIAYWKPLRQSLLHRKAKEILKEVAFERPGLSISNVHIETNRRLSAALSLQPESAK